MDPHTFLLASFHIVIPEVASCRDVIDKTPFFENNHQGIKPQCFPGQFPQRDKTSDNDALEEARRHLNSLLDKERRQSNDSLLGRSTIERSRVNPAKALALSMVVARYRETVSRNHFRSRKHGFAARGKVSAQEGTIYQSLGRAPPKAKR
jgi:hypothetical protein